MGKAKAESLGLMPTHWWAETGGRISGDRVLAVPELVCLPAVGKAGPGAGG